MVLGYFREECAFLLLDGDPIYLLIMRFILLTLLWVFCFMFCSHAVVRNIIFVLSGDLEMEGVMSCGQKLIQMLNFDRLVV